MAASPDKARMNSNAKSTHIQEVLLRFDEVAWRNIQHNENLRNVLLTIYLTVTARCFGERSKSFADAGGARQAPFHDSVAQPPCERRVRYPV